MIPVVSPANPRTPVLSGVAGVATNTTAAVLVGDAPGGTATGGPASLPMARLYPALTVRDASWLSMKFGPPEE